MRARSVAIRILRGNPSRARHAPFRFAQGRGADPSTSLRAGCVRPYTKHIVARLLQEVRLFLQVDVLHFLDGEAQESLSQAAKLFGGVGGEKLQAGYGTALFERGISIRQ